MSFIVLPPPPVTIDNHTFQSVSPSVITVSSFSFPLTFVYFALVILAAISIGMLFCLCGVVFFLISILFRKSAVL